MVQFIKKYKIPIGIFIMFEMIGILFTGIHKQVFYIFNFSYIGFFVSLTVGLMMAGKKNARILSEWAVGLYMLVFLGIVNRENMQLEGFFFFALMGIFMAAVIHYAVAKIAGPFIFGRAWCGYACWTAMVLDLFPYKVPKKEPVKKLGLLRLIVFAVSLAYFIFIYLHYETTRENVFYNMQNMMCYLQDCKNIVMLLYVDIIGLNINFIFFIAIGTFYVFYFRMFCSNIL